MEKFESLTAIAAPLLRDNIDTDAIIPSREMISAAPEVLAKGLFAGWRYREVGGREPDESFVLNDPLYRDAQILLGGENFGCGSSREHAVWALRGYGFRAVVASSFAAIFFNNCVRNGVVPVQLPAEAIAALARKVALDPRNRRLTVDLRAQQVAVHDGEAYGFSIEAYARQMLLAGLDEIDLTLTREAEIGSFLVRDRLQRPWIYEI
ncbi:MAG: 3-isopropylmalate dehydratase small subunit [Burkholderiales bacterium]|nr:MAG: 3-isopropylmalate dehydratase small subunit [Burkholderiales bacterium]